MVSIVEVVKMATFPPSFFLDKENVKFLAEVCKDDI
jgi:hypothetical protein